MKQPDWDPRSPATLRNQRDAYDKMRETCPVAYSEFLGWSLFRHDDVVAVLSDPTAFRSASAHLAIPNGMDPPVHTHYRSALAPFFDSAHMTAFEPCCQSIARELAQQAVRQGKLDFTSEIAEPFALRSQCAFLGWSEESWTELQGWMHGNQETALSRDRGTARRIAEDLERYVTKTIEERRAPDNVYRDDLMSRLMTIEVGDRPLRDEDLVSILRNWIAGHGTVAAGLSILAFHLARDQVLQARLRSEPDKLARAVDELLRLDDPLVANRRTTARETTIRGCQIAADDKLTLMWIAANRDERAFPHATTLDLDRDQSQNLVFGSGIHDCIGAPLARLELRVALEELLAETSVIELDSQAAPIRGVYPGNGFSKLPIRLLAS